MDATDEGKGTWSWMGLRESNKVENWWDMDSRGFVGGIMSAPGFLYKY